ncbi:MAG TPA: response regulator [Anaerolineales bacterium]|nr:response regulator [Anaerolineales bacterium]HNO92539.1 response regulator [Anaerolineales bacterium]
MRPPANNKIIKVAIFEDSRFDLRAIESVLKEIPGIQILGNFDTINEAIQSCKNLEPDLILVDADIRGDRQAGPLFAQSIKRILPRVKMLGLTKYSESIAQLRLAGCQEAVLKSFFDNSAVAAKFIKEALLEPPAYFKDDLPPILNPEEDMVLKMIATGKTENEIADRMSKTKRQIKDIKESLKLRFGAASNKDAQLISNAYQIRYLKPEDDLSQY